MLKHMLIPFLLMTHVGLNAQTGNPKITREELTTHVKYLASDELKGRASGTEENAIAARYIADALKSYGLLPAGDNGSFMQEFSFVASVKAGPSNAFSFKTNGKVTRGVLDNDFRPLGFSSTDSVQGPLVFVGYGISSPDKQYDDYGGIDVKGKIVLLLRYSPDGNNPHGDLYPASALREKARVAR